MAISAKELAKKLGVSAATVSMVFNNKPGISQKTRDRILKAARELGYEMPKRQEPDGEKGVIQFVIYKRHGNVVADTPFFSQLTEGINNQCMEHGYRLQISYVYQDEGDRPGETGQQIEMLRNVECSGILLLGTEMEPEDYKAFLSMPVPIVVLDSYYEGILYDTVLINNVQGAFRATEYLIRSGRKRVGYLSSKVSISNFEERADGYYKALRHNDISTSHPYVVRVTPTAEQSYLDMKEYLAGKPQLGDAYFADNDIIAAGAVRAFKEAGIKVPEDIGVIGFDDIPICQYVEPPLTTMRVEKQRLGALAVNRLVGRILNGWKETIKIELGTNLVERESV